MYENLDDYLATGRITTRLSTTAALWNCHREYCFARIRQEVKEYYLKNSLSLLKVHKDLERVDKEIESFGKTQQLLEIQQYYKNATVSGHRCDTPDLTALLWGSAGRVLLTLEDDPSNLTVIFAEDDPRRIGLQGINGTADQAINLLKFAQENTLEFRPNNQVCVA